MQARETNSLSLDCTLPSDNVAYDKAYGTARQVRRRYGDVSDMTLWRWCQNKQLGFPQPITINGRRFWRWSDLTAWEKKRAAHHE
jgi:predicted DNA-binding transcriptional regulator AlpA